MTPLDKFIETLDPKLPQRLRTPHDGNLSDVGFIEQTHMLKPEDFALAPETERRIIRRFKFISEKFCKEKKFQWSPEDFSFAASCAVAYAQTFQARTRLGFKVHNDTANMESAEGAEQKIMKAK